MAVDGDRVVVVIGAGMAGLAATLSLAAAGEPVVLLEAAARPGGKARRMPSAAGPVDAGPTVFTMRGVFEALFAQAGTSLDAEVTLVPAAILARHYWPDGSSLDLHADPDRSAAAIRAFSGASDAAAFRRISARARMLFEAFEGPVMRNPAPSIPGIAAALGPRMLRLLPAMAPLRSLAGALATEFRDPRLVQLFARYATYVGGSPFATPAFLLLVWHAEAMGVWYPQGGMAAVAAAMARLAEARGATIRLSTAATAIETDGRAITAVRLATGERIETRRVIFAGDPTALAEGLLGPGVTGLTPRLAPRERSLSAWVWHFAGQPSGVALDHHTVFFSADYRAEFADLFTHRRPPADPTVYVCAQDRLPGRPLPVGQERLMMIMNAPAEGDRRTPTTEEIAACQTRVFSRLAASGLTIDPPEGEGVLTTDWDFARTFPGSAGAIYGRAPHGMFATFRRPTTRTALPGLFLASGAAHPGPGVAMACLSGQLAAGAILADRASTSASPRTAMRGGMSMGSRTTASGR